MEKAADAANYSREAKALLWQALYGKSHEKTNPYGSIREFKLKSDVGVDTGSGWKNDGKGGRRRYRRGGGRRGSDAETEKAADYLRACSRSPRARPGGGMSVLLR